MKPVYIFPGSFCPPTYGHVEIAKRAANLFGEITIICSTNPEKEKSWFTPKECKEMWQTYNLCPNIKLQTLEEFGRRSEKEREEEIVMVRGIRDDRDLEYEKNVVLLNFNRFGVKNFFYMISEGAFRDISSTSARESAENLDLMKLGAQVSPMVVSKMLEKVLNIRNLYMAVGKPGCGKSTFLKTLSQRNPQNIFINTDEFTHQLKPMLAQVFGDKNLVDMAIENSEEIKKIIGAQWLELLKIALKAVPRNSNVFLEIPYGFQPDKMSFRFVGGKVIYIECKNEEQNKERIINRGTPEIVKFIDYIPGKEETLKIAREHKLLVTCVDTSGTLEDLKNEAARIDLLILAEKEVDNV